MAYPKLSNLSDVERGNLENREWLYEQHHIKNKTLREISAELKISRYMLTSYFQKLNVPLKTSRHISIETKTQLDDIAYLKSLHYEKQMTVEAIAEMLGVKHFTIHRRFKKAGIETIRWDAQAYKKRQKTCLAKYGRHHIKQTCLSDEAYLKLKNADWLKQQHIVEKRSIIDIANELEVEPSTIVKNLKGYKIPRKYYKNHTQGEKQIREYICSIYDGPIDCHTRSLFPKTEIDMHFPEKNLAIEFNGLYWHTTRHHVKPSYHLDKTLKCAAKGIRLYHIREDEWNEKQAIWKSILKNAFGQCGRRVFARKCEVKVIDKSTERNFLNNYHLQGYTSSKIAYGLFSGDELLSVMSFGRPRFSKKYEWEMIRYCVCLDTIVVGGASKLFAEFVKTYQPKHVVSYADRRYSDGRLYSKLGFAFLNATEPNYWYLINRNLEPRYKWQKHKLSKKLEVFDPLLSEKQNMENNGYYRLFDCGHLTFVWQNKNLVKSA